MDLVGNALNQFSANKAKERREQGIRPLTAKAFVKLANKYFEELPEPRSNLSSCLCLIHLAQVKRGAAFKLSGRQPGELLIDTQAFKV